MQLPISNFFWPSSIWVVEAFLFVLGFYFEGIHNFIPSYWLSSLIQLLCKVKSGFSSMSDELWSSQVVELLLLTKCKENPFRVAVEKKLLLKPLLHEPRNKLACCRKRGDVSHYLGAGSQSVRAVSSSCSTRTEASLWGMQSSNTILPRLINRYRLDLLFAPDSTFAWKVLAIPWGNSSSQRRGLLRRPCAPTISRGRKWKKPTPISMCCSFLFLHPAGEGCCASHAFALAIVTAVGLGGRSGGWHATAQAEPSSSRRRGGPTSRPAQPCPGHQGPSAPEPPPVYPQVRGKNLLGWHRGLRGRSKSALFGCSPDWLGTGPG